jgi:hypothetical protein
MSWAAKRKTTIAEDKACCLMGIFDIYLPLIYGEGVKNAFIRLQDEINRRLSFNGGGTLISQLPIHGRSTVAKFQGRDC